MNELVNLEILTKTFDGLPVGVGIFHIPDLENIRDIRYVYMNKVVLYEMKKSKEEVFGKSILEVAPEAYEHPGGLMVLETYKKVAAEGGEVNLGLVEYSNHMVAGTYECSVHQIQKHYVYVMLRNVTELEKAKNDLEIKNQELNQFAMIASHDLKEPLNSLSGVIQLFRSEYEEKLDDQANELLSFMSQANKRMLSVINDILDYGRLGQGKELTTIDCSEVMEVIKQDFTAKLSETNTTLQVGELPIIKGYKTEVRLLFQNLISNAIKFRRPDVAPIVKVSVEQKNGWTFAVQDNGIGIAEEHKDKIFNIFKRLHSEFEYEGSGVGLAHCKKIVDLHKGKILVESEQGVGSTFYFTIPEDLASADL